MRAAIYSISLILGLWFCTQTAIGAQSNPLVHHVVLVWLNDDISEQQRSDLIKETYKLRSIDVVQAMHVGASISSERAIVDDSFSFGVTITFNNAQDMNRYLTDPQHVEFVEKTLKPFVRKIVVYDY